jgi:hypothetical protein
VMLTGLMGTDKKVPFPTDEFKKDSEWISFKDIFKNYLDSVPSVRRTSPGIPMCGPLARCLTSVPRVAQPIVL